MNAHKREWAFTGIIGLTHGAQHFFSRLIPPLIPIMAVELQLPLWKLGLLISVYQMGLGFGQAPLGVLSDRYDRRYLLGRGWPCWAAATSCSAWHPPWGVPSLTYPASGTR